MEERGNKTIMCSVLFLDIVEYSKKSVAGQISLKDRFNSYLSAAISDVPVSDRIILDTGDGAAINFLGDVEDALKAALSLRESILREDPSIDPPLLVRVGINLGPVRLVRDINGQPNIVGDGINVAQRVMGFADVNQILVSRSYYDAASRLSPQYAGMFLYQGSRTDKHVREHEVYAVGHPGDKTSESKAIDVLAAQEAHPSASGSTTQILAPVKSAWNSAASKLDEVIRIVVERFAQAEPKQRALYGAAIAIPLALLIGLGVKLSHRSEVSAVPDAASTQASVQPISAVVVAPTVAHAKTAVTAPEPSPAETQKPAQKAAESKSVKEKAKHQEAQPKAKTHDAAQSKKAAGKKTDGAEHGNEAYITVSCIDGTLLYVDGTQKGKTSSGSLTVTITPGKHAVIVSHPSKGVFSQSVEFVPGKTVRMRPDFCN